MYSVFKEPIICNLRPSYKLACGFFIIGLLPIASISLLFGRFPVLVIATNAFILLVSLCLINRYALRSTARSVSQLRLHKNQARISFNNGVTQSARITRISAMSDWIVLDFGQATTKVLLDTSSVGQSTFKQIARQVRNTQARSIHNR